MNKLLKDINKNVVLFYRKFHLNTESWNTKKEIYAFLVSLFEEKSFENNIIII